MNYDLFVYFTVVFEDVLCLLLSVVDVVDDFAVFKEDNAFADIDGVLQIVAADENRGTCLFIVLLQ